VLPISIGRDAACTIALEDPHKHMSRFHVEIEEEDGTYWMSVVSKVNRVMVKGRRYGPGARVTLQSGDSFELAEYEVQVLLPEPAPAEATAPPADDRQVLGTSTQIRRAAAGRNLHSPKTGRAAEPSAARVFRRRGPAAERALADADRRHAARLRRDPARRDRGHHDADADTRRDAQGIRTDGFLEPVQAVGDACQDLCAHELTLMAGMRGRGPERAAATSILRRLKEGR
jgi:predicted component of type VI protein secretion system